MYGFIYNTLRSLVVENYSEEVWRELCKEANAESLVEGILDHTYYDESMIYRLVVATSEKLNVSKDMVLQNFGNFFFKVCKTTGHSSMLRTLGHDLHGFLMNLDSLHDHLSFTYTQMQAPSFRCEKTRTGIILHYHTARKGLDSIVAGIVKEVAKDFYSLDIEMQMIKYEETDNKLAHHYIFQIDAKEATDENIARLTGDVRNIYTAQQGILSPVEDSKEEMTFAPTLITLGTNNPTNCNPNGRVTSSGGNGSCPYVSSRSHSTGQMITKEQESLIGQQSTEVKLQLSESGLEVFPQSPVPDSDDTINLRKKLRETTIGLPATENALPQPMLPALSSISRIASRRGSIVPMEYINWPITPHIFQNCFPFHIIFDHNLVIRYLGVSLIRLMPKAIATKAKLTDYFDLIRPSLPLTYKNIRESLHNIFILCLKAGISISNSSGKEALQFRGQMIPTSIKEKDCQILFLASPRISTIEELEHQGLYMSDIPVHDVTRDLLLLNRHFRVEMNIATELEKTKKELQNQKSQVEKEKKRADDLLHAMLPRVVANELINGSEPKAVHFTAVTILFSDIKGFTTICNQCQPIQIVDMLNSLYTRFDSLLERHNVYKVETIGDAYMVAAGLLDTSKVHAEAVANMAFGMREEAGQVIDVNNTPIQIRIGIHSGPVVAGVVGKKMPRYCLFGDTVNTASRMESHGEAGYVHISEATYDLLKGNPYVFYSRGYINIKGLGKKQTYFVEPATAENAKVEVIVIGPDSDEERAFQVNKAEPLAEEKVTRNPSFVTFGNTCTLVKTPSSSFINPTCTNPINPMFEPEGTCQNSATVGPSLRSLSTGCLEMKRLENSDNGVSEVEPSTPTTLSVPGTVLADQPVRPAPSTTASNKVAPTSTSSHFSSSSLAKLRTPVIHEVPSEDELATSSNTHSHPVPVVFYSSSASQTSEDDSPPPQNDREATEEAHDLAVATDELSEKSTPKDDTSSSSNRRKRAKKCVIS